MRGVLELLSVFISCRIRGTKILSGEGLRGRGVSLSKGPTPFHTLKYLSFPLIEYLFKRTNNHARNHEKGRTTIK